MRDDWITKWGPLIGYLVALTSLINSTLAATTAQALRGAVPDFQLAIGRSIVQVLAYLLIGKACKLGFSIERNFIPALILLGIACMAYHVGYFGATTFVPLVEVSGVVSIVTIISAFLTSKLMYGVNITKCHIFSCTIGIVGILIAIQPPWLFHPMTSMYSSKNSDTSKSMEQYSNEDSKKASQQATGWVLAIIGGAAFGITYDVNSRQLHNIKPLIKAVYLSGGILVASVLLLFYFQDPVFTLTFKQSMLILAHCTSSAITFFCDLQAAHLLGGSQLAVVYSFEVLFMLISQYTIMHSVMPGNGNWLEVFGCVVLITGGSIVPITEMIMHWRGTNELP